MTYERTIDHAPVDVFPFEIRGDDTRLADRLCLPTFQEFVIEYIFSEERERERGLGCLGRVRLNGLTIASVVVAR